MSNQSLLDILEEVQKAGYTEEIRFHTKKVHLHALAKDLVMEANDFTVDRAYRFEGSTSEVDVSELYAISSSKHKIKGFLIDELDEYRRLPDHPLVEKLMDAEKTTHLYDESDQEQKFGVPKIYKIKFEEDPERYELRKGFPDFPVCPYGNSFSMLGFDKKEKRYVWLVSSIIKDDRLVIKEYSAN